MLLWNIKFNFGTCFVFQYLEYEFFCFFFYAITIIRVFLVSQSFVDNVFSAENRPFVETRNISLHSNPKGRGVWKLNTSFLTSTDYIDMMKLLDQTQKEYRNVDTVNRSLLCRDMIKTKVREKSISYAIGKKRQAVNKGSVLEETFGHLKKN